MPSRDSGLPGITRNTVGTSGNVFESLLARQGRYVQTTTRPDHGCLEIRTQIGEATQKREKQEWANEKPKLENTRRTTGIYFIDPQDQEYEETIENARKKLEKHMDAAMPCKKEDTKPDLLTATRFQQRSMLEKWNLMNPQGNEWNHLH